MIRPKHPSRCDKTYHVLSSPHSSDKFGFSETRGDRYNSYVVGFERHKDALDVVRNKRSRTMNMQRKTLMDLSYVLEGTRGVKHDLVVSPSAHLHITSTKAYRSNPTKNGSNNTFYLETLSAPEFFAMRFEHQIGLVIARNRVFYENDDFIFDCQVIEPSSDVESFTRMLVSNHIVDFNIEKERDKDL